MEYHINDVIKLSDTPLDFGLILDINDKLSEDLTIFNLKNHIIKTISSSNNYCKVNSKKIIYYVVGECRRYIQKSIVDSYIRNCDTDREVYTRSIDDLFKSCNLEKSVITRIINCLTQKNEIKTILDLLCCAPFELKRIRNLGNKTYFIIVVYLLKYCELNDIKPIFTTEEYMDVL